RSRARCRARATPSRCPPFRGARSACSGPGPGCVGRGAPAGSVGESYRRTGIPRGCPRPVADPVTTYWGYARHPPGRPHMKLGVPTETRPLERRVSVTPETAKKLVKLGFEVQ